MRLVPGWPGGIHARLDTELLHHLLLDVSQAAGSWRDSIHRACCSGTSVGILEVLLSYIDHSTTDQYKHSVEQITLIRADAGCRIWSRLLPTVSHLLNVSKAIQCKISSATRQSAMPWSWDVQHCASQVHIFVLISQKLLSFLLSCRTSTICWQSEKLTQLHNLLQCQRQNIKPSSICKVIQLVS